MKKLMIVMLMVGAMGQVGAVVHSSAMVASEIKKLNRDIFMLGARSEKGVAGLVKVLSQAELIQKAIAGQAQKMFGLMEMRFEQARSVQDLNDLTADALESIAQHINMVADSLKR